MIGGRSARRLLAVGCAVVLSSTGCAFHGLNSLPLPGAVGRGPSATVYHAEVANVGTMESNSPVMIDDVVVGSVGEMRVKKSAEGGWHAYVDFSVKPEVVVPANATAVVGQTSLLGSMHLDLNPPLGEAPSGRLAPGATIAMDRSSTYPSTEQTLSSLAAVVNSGGLGQIGDIIHNTNIALSSRTGQVRDLLIRLGDFVGVLDRQQDNIIATIEGLDRLAGTFADQRGVISEALHKVPPALDVLLKERPSFTTALEKLGEFSDVGNRLVNEGQDDLVRNLKNLGPTLNALAEVGEELPAALAWMTVFPYGQDLVDRGVRGDYFNLFAILDLTVPRLKKGMMLGTRWGEENAPLTPAPGDPPYLQYTYDPLGVGVAQPSEEVPASPSLPGPLPGPPLPGPPAGGGS